MPQVDEYAHRRMDKAEKSLARLSNNPAPTIPKYDLGLPALDTGNWYLAVYGDHYNGTSPPPALTYTLPHKMSNIWLRLVFRGDLPYAVVPEGGFYIGFVPQEAVEEPYYAGDGTLWDILPAFGLTFFHTDIDHFLAIHAENTSHVFWNSKSGDPLINNPPFGMGGATQTVDMHLEFSNAFSYVDDTGGEWHTEVYLNGNKVWESHDAMYGDLDNHLGSPTYGQHIPLAAAGYVVAVVIYDQYGGYLSPSRICMDDISIGTGRGLSNIFGPLTFDGSFAPFVDSSWDGTLGNPPSFIVEQP